MIVPMSFPPIVLLEAHFLFLILFSLKGLSRPLLALEAQVKWFHILARPAEVHLTFRFGLKD